ncbi:hypothetical protein UlMin_003671 [Ulmus minor]
MELIKTIMIIAITMAISITITMKAMVPEVEEEKSQFPQMGKSTMSFPLDDNKQIILPSKRVSRFLADNERNPRAADHCHKDNEICTAISGGRNTTCCNNKCIELSYDDQNCGACKKKCKFTQTCCRGECVDLNYDKRHCGKCNNRCKYGEYCVYGLCDYA